MSITRYANQGQKKPCSHLIKVLVGCKTDKLLTSEASTAAVPAKRARDFAKKNGFLLFFETTSIASTNSSNIPLLFEELCMELISNYIKYLNYQASLLNLISIPCTNPNSFMLYYQNQSNTIFPLNDVRQTSTHSDVYYNCATEKLNCNHIIMNLKNLKRRNLQTKRFEIMDLF